MLVTLNVDWLIGYAGSPINVVVVVTDFYAIAVVVFVVAVAVYSNFDIFQGFVLF